LSKIFKFLNLNEIMTSTSEMSVVRVPKKIIEELREVLPDVTDEGDAVVVRVALRKFLKMVKEGKTSVLTQ